VIVERVCFVDGVDAGIMAMGDSRTFKSMLKAPLWGSSRMPFSCVGISFSIRGRVKKNVPALTLTKVCLAEGRMSFFSE